MKPLIIDCPTWEEAIALTEWYCLELAVDRLRPRDSAEHWALISSAGQGAVRVLNRVITKGALTRLSKALRTNFPRPVPGAMRLEAFCRLLDAVDKAYALFPKIAITQAERRRKAKVMSAAARVIAAELAHPATATDLRMAWSLFASEGVLLPVRGAVKLESFEALALMAERMVELPKVVGNPNSGTAHRLYFIREMTDYFAANYGKPKRSLVLVLAELYFDVSDLSSNDLAKYAPVKKSRIRGRLSSPPNSG